MGGAIGRRLAHLSHLLTNRELALRIQVDDAKHQASQNGEVAGRVNRRRGS